MELVRQRAPDRESSRPSSSTLVTSSPTQYRLPAIQSNALYMDRYRWCRREAPDRQHPRPPPGRARGGIVAHGCTGMATTRCASRLDSPHGTGSRRVLAPVRDYAWTREKARSARAEENAIPINVSKRSPSPSTRTCGAG